MDKSMIRAVRHSCEYQTSLIGLGSTHPRVWRGETGEPERLLEALVRIQRQQTRRRGGANQTALAWFGHPPFQVIPILGSPNSDPLADALSASNARLTEMQTLRLTDPTKD